MKTFSRESHYRILIGFVFIAAALYMIRLNNSVQIGVTGDDARYLIQGESYLRGRPMRVINFPASPLDTVFPPGYGLFLLAPLQWLLGDRYELIRLTSLILTLGSISCFIAFIRAHDRVSPFWYWPIAFFALNPTVAGMTTIIRSEPLYLFLVLLFLFGMKRLVVDERVIPFLEMIVIGLLLAVIILIRYQGVALLAATSLYFGLRRQWRTGVIIILTTCFGILPLILFFSLSGESTNSVFAFSMLGQQLITIWDRLGITLFKYITTIPLVMIPALGPRVMQVAETINMVWVIQLIHLIIFTITAIGFTRSMRKRQLIALYTLCYFGLIVIIDNQGSGLYHNEVRYIAIMLPFLYLFFIDGLHQLHSAYLNYNSIWVRKLPQIIYGLIIVVFAIRNVQQVSVSFPITDLSLGAEWIRANTDTDAVVMTRDPSERYLYLQRRTTFIPEISAESNLPDILNTMKGVDYILVAPPLKLNGKPNTSLTPHPADTELLEIHFFTYPQTFIKVWQDGERQAVIYRIVTE